MALAVLVVFTGASGSFINLSSLHNFYASRLTRAYLGAANSERLQEVDEPGPKGNFRDSLASDDMMIRHYQAIRTPAPLHLINCTLNETTGRDSSTTVDRDRKGVPLVFAPDGVFLDAAAGARRYGSTSPSRWHFTWDDVDSQAERLSLGQLCAISGAAVATGMGSYTSVGRALVLAFGNLRLGYWWQAGALLARGPKKPGWSSTYCYLGAEMLAQFSRSTRRVYISDGGHFENSGAYELLRRKVAVALVLDNGEDSYAVSSGLEALVRKARLDMGLDIEAASEGETRDALKEHPGVLNLMFNTAPEGWRAAAADPTKLGIALLLKVTGLDVPPGRPRWIVWVKPRLTTADSIDIQGYAGAHADFPRETTADQFFNEAQWESYRAIGQRTIARLLAASTDGRLLRDLAAKAG